MRLSWRGTNVLFFCTAGVNFLAEGHTNAFTPLYLRDLGLDSSEVALWTGLLFAVTTACAFCTTPFLGVLAERFSRRNMILRTYILTAAGLLLTAWAPHLAFVVPARALVGFGAGSVAVMVATQALLNPKSRIGPAIALVQSAQPISASLGPPLGSVLIPHIGIRSLYVMDAGVLLVASVAIFLLMPEPKAPVRPGSVLRRTAEVLQTAWRLEPVRWNFIAAFGQRGAAAVVDSYLPVRITEIAADPAAAIGWTLGIYGAFTTFATWYVGRLLQRVDEALIYTRTAIAATVITIGMAIVPSIWLLGILAVLRSVPVAFSNTVLHTHAARVLPPIHQTSVLSMSPMPRNLGGLLFPIVAAASVGFGPGAPLAVGALSYLSCCFAGARLHSATSRFRKQVAEAEQASASNRGTADTGRAQLN